MKKVPADVTACAWRKHMNVSSMLHSNGAPSTYSTAHIYDSDERWLGRIGGDFYLRYGPSVEARGVSMFGMLDYRAHKLYWLLSLPLRVLARAMFLVAVGVGVIIAQSTQYEPWIKYIIAYVGFELSGLVIQIVWTLVITWPFNKIFFWMIDVLPSKGENEEEAKQVVIQGPSSWLSKKLTEDIENWTEQDTEDFVSAAYNWRARWFFDARERFYKRVAILQSNYFETGRQPGSLRLEELNELVGPIEYNWFQKAIIWPHSFNSIMGIIIIILVLPLFSR